MFETIFGYLLVDSPSMQRGHFDGLKTKIEALDGAYAKIKKQADSIRKSTSLTASGKKEARTKLGTQVVEIISAVSAKENFGTLRAHAADIEKSVRKNATPKEAGLRDFLRAQEIRAHYKNLDQIHQQAFLEEAISENHIESIEALRDSPFSLPGLSKKLNQEMLAAYDADDLQRLDPEKAAERASLLEADAEIHIAMKTMAKTLRDDGIDVPFSDDIRELAESTDEDDTEKSGKVKRIPFSQSTDGKTNTSERAAW